MGSGGTTEARFKRWGERLGLALAGPTMLVLFAAGIYAIGDAVLAPAPTPDHPGFVDTVLGSRAVVAAIRLAVIFAGAFVVVSVVALIARGQWLTKVGPVQVSERVSDIGGGSQRLTKSVEKTEETVDGMRKTTREIDDLIERMTRDSKGVQ